MTLGEFSMGAFALLNGARPFIWYEIGAQPRSLESFPKLRPARPLV